MKTIFKFSIALFVSLQLVAGPVNLTWNDNANNEDGFKMERAVGIEGEFIQIASNIPANATSFQDTFTNPETTYRYRLRAFNENGNSGYSNIATVTTAAGPGPVPANPGGVGAVEERVSRLINISTRATVVSGDNIMIGGFIIEGTTPMKVLIRGVGPGLARFGLGPVLADPELVLYKPDGTELARNNDWPADPALVAATAQEQAFAFADGSKDAAMLVTLPPGVYTPHLRDAGNSPGVGLIEIYEVSP